MSLDLRLAVTDQPVGTLPWKIRCPDRIHKERMNGKLDKENSLAIYPDNIHCYGCGFDRSKEWALAVLLDVPLAEARQQMSHYDSDSLDAYRERAAQEATAEPLPASLAEVYSAVLLNGPRANRLPWLQARGLTLETIKQWQIGHDGNRFVIPLFDANGTLLTLRYRRDDLYADEKQPKYCGMKGRNGLYLFGANQVKGMPKALWITEGELDAIRLHQEKINAVSATNGAGQVHKLPALIREWEPRVEILYIATDQDEPGHEAARLTKLAAEELGFRTYRVHWEGQAKDVTEALNFGEVLDAIRVAA